MVNPQHQHRSSFFYDSYARRGFTIVELLIVVVIIAVLAAVVVVSYNGLQKRAQNAAIASEENKVAKQLELSKVANGAYPDSIASCPAPTAGNLCLIPQNGMQYAFTNNPAGGAGPQVVAVSGYDMTVMAKSVFSYKSNTERTSTNEFMQYVDLAPIIDRYGLRSYQLSFDIKSANVGTASSVRVYFQNGSTSKYGGLNVNVPVTTSYVRQSITFMPTLYNGAVAESWLAFYGTYSSGNIPSVKNVLLTLAP